MGDLRQRVRVYAADLGMAVWQHAVGAAMTELRKLDMAYAEIERLRAALKPFAEQDVSKMISLDELNLDKEDFERARAAYQQKESGAAKRENST